MKQVLSRHARLLAALTALALGLAPPALGQPTEPPPLHAVPLAPGERIVLDGTLSHPAWQRSPVFGRFVEMQPQRGGEPPQATRVQMLYDEQALYVGVTALETQPARIRDDIVRADQVNRTQDFVVVYVDAIGLRQSAQFFRLNAAGSMADGMHTAADDSEDFAPDFDWDGRVARSAEGWTAVFRLPFASLRYAAGSEHTEAPWRVMVARRIPRDQFHLVMSVHLPREASSFIGQLQRLEGLRLPEKHTFLVLRPSLTWRRTSDARPPAATRREQELDASLDLKWRPRAELVLDATLNPDFSQVALDVPQLSGNTRFALSLAEKRPFFFESSDLLRSPTEAFYTRSFTAPRWGLRGTWRGADRSGSAFALDDRGGGVVLLPQAFGTGEAVQPASRVLAARGLWDRGAVQWGGLAVARRYEEERGDNTVFGPDLGWQISDTLRLRAQWLHSSTGAVAVDGDGLLARGPRQEGDRLFAKLFHQGQLTEADLELDLSDAGFRHDSGFVNQAGVRKATGFASTGWENVGPFNEFWLNLEGEHVAARGSGERVSAGLWPGLWSSAARNLEWTLQWRGLSTLRTGPGRPLLHERYWHSQLVMTPAAWAPLLDATLDWGRLADTAASTESPGGSVRRGGRANVLLRLRPARRLELEPTLYAAWLRDAGQLAYRESSAQLLAIWHLDARSHLRLIVQRYSIARRAEPGLAATRFTDDAGSLTWSHRWSAGSVIHVGAGRTRQGPPDASGQRPSGSEFFVKLQADVDELRRAL